MFVTRSQTYLALFFLFEAEDGIRDDKVTGVQTCALPILKRPGYLIATFGMPLFVAAYGAIVAIPAYYAEMKDQEQQIRSEERRVGKGGRERGAGGQQTKTGNKSAGDITTERKMADATATE